ncbi:MAG: hypothetical protein Q9169_003145 [Polycauliona sp. 2 TL-2023]
MLHSYILLAISAAIHAKPFALPQAVTENISPSGPPPPGCKPSVAGTYGIAVQNVSNPAVQAKRQITQFAGKSLLLLTSLSTPASLPQRLAMDDDTLQSPAASGTTMVACKSEGTLAITLDNSVLKDSQQRTGYIASNFQFQFDGPPQAGAIYTSGFSACSNGSLALGGSNVFYQCLSGDFYNLYDRGWAPTQCSQIIINLVELQDCP